MKLIKTLAAAGLALAATASHAQTFTGVSGPGWREISFPASSATHPSAQSVQPYDAPRASVLYQIDDANGLAASPLPQAVKDNITRDGWGSGPIFVDRDIAKALADGTATTKYAAYVIPDSRSAYNSVEGVEGAVNDRASIQSVTPQGIFCDGGWRTYTIDKSFPVTMTQRLAGDANAQITFNGNAQGSVEAQVQFEYKKSDWSACIPYAVRFKQAEGKGSISFDNSTLALTASASTSFGSNFIHEMLYEQGGSAMIGPIPVWWDYGVPLDIGYKVLLNASATANFGSQLSGKVTFDYVCHDGGCTGTRDTSTLNFHGGAPGLGTQADATFDPYVQVGVRGRLYPVSENAALASAGVALKFSTPFEVYGYYGNACGDSNQDGVNELANTYFVDWQARLSLVTSWSVFNAERTNYIGFDSWAAQKINGALYHILNNEGHVTPLWHKDLYFKDSTPSGKTSIFSPVLRLQTVTSSNGTYHYTVRTSMRPCVALDTNYRVNIAGPSGTSTVTVTGKTGYTDTVFSSSSPSLLLTSTGVSDDDGRTFSSSGDVAPTMVVPAGPSAHFTSTVSGLTATFTDASSETTGVISAVSWKFGDGASASGRNVSHTYAAGGTYTVTETVTDGNGKTAVASASVTVTPPPPPGIVLPDGAQISSVVSPYYDPTVTLNLLPSGAASVSGWASTAIHSWASGGSNPGGLVEVLATQVGGDLTVTGSGLGVWLGLGAQRSWTSTYFHADGCDSLHTAKLLLQFRSASTHTALASRTMQFSLKCDSSIGP